MGVEVVFVQVIDGPWGPLAYGHGRLLGCDEGIVLERRLADHVLLLVWGIEVLYGELEIGGGAAPPRPPPPTQRGGALRPFSPPPREDHDLAAGPGRGSSPAGAHQVRRPSRQPPTSLPGGAGRRAELRQPPLEQATLGVVVDQRQRTT